MLVSVNFSLIRCLNKMIKIFGKVISVFNWKNKWIFNIFILKINKHLLTSNEYINTHYL